MKLETVLTAITTCFFTYIITKYFTNDISKNKKYQKKPKIKQKEDIEDSFPITTVAICKSIFPEKNGTPRQFGLCENSKGVIEFDLRVNPKDSLANLEEVSHIYIIYLFHENTNMHRSQSIGDNKAKVKRLGKKVGLFSTRTPHRPNPVGLSIAKIDKIKENKIYVSGIDLVNNTPIIDIKPYIFEFDSIENSFHPKWISDERIMKEVNFTEEAIQQLSELVNLLEFYDNFEDIQNAISEILSNDIRSLYRKNQGENFHRFSIDKLNVKYEIENNNTILVYKIEKDKMQK